MDQLEELYQREGRPGADALYIAAKRSESDALRALPKTRIREFIAKQPKKQELTAPAPSKGKVASESLNARWQMDMMDTTRFKAQFWLVCVNVFDRKIYAEQCFSRAPEDVITALELILRTAPKPKFIQCDQGPSLAGKWRGS